MTASNNPGSQWRQNIIVLELCLTGRRVVAMPYVRHTVPSPSTPTVRA